MDCDEGNMCLFWLCFLSLVIFCLVFGSVLGCCKTGLEAVDDVMSFFVGLDKIQSCISDQNYCMSYSFVCLDFFAACSYLGYVDGLRFLDSQLPRQVSLDSH